MKYEQCKQKIDSLSEKSFLNSAQRKIFLKILKNVKNDHDRTDIFNQLFQRVKVGLTFDESPLFESNDIYTLKYEKNKSITQYKKNDFENSLIIGENFDVLNNLLVTYKEKVDVIYIDPPYNTNEFSTPNKSYKDKFTKSAWLTMMKERLVLARKLMKSSAVIFISIDDNMQAYLKVLMDEIFGEENFVCNFIWHKKNTGGGTDKKTIDVEHEYILVYQKNMNNSIFRGKEIDHSKYKYEDLHKKVRGKYNLTDLDRVSSESSFKYSESLDYKIKAPDGSVFINHRNIKKPKSYRYTLGEDLFKYSLKNDFIVIKKTKSGNSEYWKAFRKIYEKVTIDRKNKEIILRTSGNNFSSLILKNEKGEIMTSGKGKKELISILNNKDFPFPKPKELIIYILKSLDIKNGIILDFFAGSGTTAHAVMELNKQDGGDRKFILCTNKENNIHDICYERLYRIITGVSTNKTSFDWVNKNKPYNKNLNVFGLQHHNIDVHQNKNILSDIDLQPYKILNNKMNIINNKKFNILYSLVKHIINKK